MNAGKNRLRVWFDGEKSKFSIIFTRDGLAAEELLKASQIISLPANLF